MCMFIVYEPLAKGWKLSNYPSVDEWINKVW